LFFVTQSSVGHLTVAFDPEEVASEEKRCETQDNTAPDQERCPIQADAILSRIVTTNVGFGAWGLIVPRESIQRAGGYECDYREWVHRAYGDLADGD
jgi:hypothetical protein